MPGPAVTRELSVVYTPPGGGDFVIGGTSAVYLLDAEDNPISIEKVYGHGSLAFDLLAADTTEVLAATAWTALEAAMRKPKGRVQLIQGAQTLLDWNPTAGASGNTGFNVAITCEVPGHKKDTGRSRLYRIRFDADLPADQAGYDGRQESSINITFAASRRRRLQVKGRYTALTTNNAEAQYTAKAKTYIDTIKTALMGTWGLPLVDTYERNHEDKTLEFHHVCDELIFSTGAGAGVVSDSELAEANLVIGKLDQAPGDSQGLGPVQRLTEMPVHYEVTIDATKTTNLADRYASKIRPWILTNVQAIARDGILILAREQAGFNPDNNKLTVEMLVKVPTTQILMCTITTEDFEDSGTILTAVWAKDARTKVKDQGPINLLRKITRTRTVRGTFKAGKGPGGTAGKGGSGGSSSGSALGIFDLNAGAFGLDFDGDWGGGLGAVLGDGIPRGMGTRQGSGRSQDGSVDSSDPFSGLASAMLWRRSFATNRTEGLPGYSMPVTDLVDEIQIAFYVEAPSTGGGGKDPANATGQNHAPVDPNPGVHFDPNELGADLA